MKTVRLFAGLAVASVAFLATAVAMAQSAPTRVRGTISAIDGKTVTIATREGPTATIKLNDTEASQARRITTGIRLRDDDDLDEE